MFPHDAEIACKDADPEIFFPHPTERVKTAMAKAYCRQCVFVAECLHEAIRIHDNDSVRGGLTAKERRSLVRSKRYRR